MKVGIVNTFGDQGGAAISTKRLYKCMKKYIDVDMICKYSNDEEIKIIKSKKVSKSKILELIDRNIVRLYRNRALVPFSPNIFSSNKYIDEIINEEFDIVNLNWINFGFLNVNQITKIKSPIVWTLHDSWAFTGGCHIPYECKKYVSGCEKCKQLNSSIKYDLSKIVFDNKYKKWNKMNMTIVAPSKWLSDKCKESKIFKNNRIEVIYNGIDTNKYKPRDKNIARRRLGLDINKKIIVFGAVNSTQDENKGFKYLIESLKYVQQMDTNIQLVVFGSRNKDNLKEFKNIKIFGEIEDEDLLIDLYCASDTLVIPSKSENLPNIILEAMACKLPCVAFRVGGIPEIIEHKINGYLAEPYNIEDLSNGILWALDNRETIEESARLTIIEKFDIDLNTRKYIELYNDIMNNS